MVTKLQRRLPSDITNNFCCTASIDYVHSFISCFFFVDFFSCENKSSSRKKKNDVRVVVESLCSTDMRRMSCYLVTS